MQTLVMERMPGTPLSQVDMRLRHVMHVMMYLGVIIIRLAWRGISHNDLRPDNVMVSRNGCVSLVDFDQAGRGGFLGCLGAAFLALGPLRRQVHSSFLGLARDQLQLALPPRVLRVVKVLMRRPVRAAAPALPAVCDEPAAHRLRQAWRTAAAAGASSPGRAIAYYGLSVGGLHLPGERSWAERWAYLRLATRWRGRRVLELGCNMALLSIFALKDEGAAAALAVDRDPEILGAAALVAEAFEVQPALLGVDFDRDPDWEEALAAFRPDVVFALSLLNWVEDKARLLAFLARFEEVIFEGHESGTVERRRLRAAGFSDIELICSSERGRPVFLCRK